MSLPLAITALSTLNLNFAQARNLNPNLICPGGIVVHFPILIGVCFQQLECAFVWLHVNVAHVYTFVYVIWNTCVVAEAANIYYQSTHPKCRRSHTPYRAVTCSTLR